ncbi:HNH endonuclease [Haliovirga abyssi]|uniref:HNH domain-containing protein n=1 Tax=Haliovirga abyssi TaxID=2996794 RepID=A0AAU9DZQ2_9FUSO|nr:HNH endonuclease signature motif containing protein [Haliovirga abyssi]BDU49485.1 hypothetical protein HLVA_00540 [Haliovirga abyssi]
MIIKNDYRNTSYTLVDFSIDDKKEKFMKEFRKKHKRAKNVYTIVKEKQNEFNRPFREIYNNRCVYCGVTNQIITDSNFEVDHIFPKSKEGETSINVNGIDNIASACKTCNRGKSDYTCKDENFDKINPDKNFLPHIFFREKDYSIQIKTDYILNDDIKALYNALEFGTQLRRIDYLVMQLKDFCEKYSEESIIEKMNKIISKLEQNRREIY